MKAPRASIAAAGAAGLAGIAVTTSLAAGLVGPRSVRFFAEEVTLCASRAPLGLEVEGVYHLRNEGLLPLSLPIRFPFAAGPEVTSSRLDLVELDGQPVDSRFDQAGAGFSLHLPARQEASLRVRYRQRLARPVGRYVVTTVRDWGHPVARARFEVRLPEGCTLNSATEPIEPSTGVGTALSFWPEHDLEFGWSCED